MTIQNGQQQSQIYVYWRGDNWGQFHLQIALKDRRAQCREVSAPLVMMDHDRGPLAKKVKIEEKEDDSSKKVVGTGPACPIYEGTLRVGDKVNVELLLFSCLVNKEPL